MSLHLSPDAIGPAAAAASSAKRATMTASSPDVGSFSKLLGNSLELQQQVAPSSQHNTVQPLSQRPLQAGNSGAQRNLPSDANPASFNEAAYLSANPDVAAAINSGIFAAARDHWQQYGQFEQRPKFDERTYLAANPDVADAVSRGVFQSGLEHWSSFGRYENRQNTMTGLASSARAATPSGESLSLGRATDPRLTEINSSLNQGLSLSQIDQRNGWETGTSAQLASSYVHDRNNTVRSQGFRTPWEEQRDPASLLVTTAMGHVYITPDNPLYYLDYLQGRAAENRPNINLPDTAGGQSIDRGYVVQNPQGFYGGTGLQDKMTADNINNLLWYHLAGDGGRTQDLNAIRAARGDFDVTHRDVGVLDAERALSVIEHAYGTAAATLVRQQWADNVHQNTGTRPAWGDAALTVSRAPIVENFGHGGWNPAFYTWDEYAHTSQRPGDRFANASPNQIDLYKPATGGAPGNTISTLE